MRSVASGSEGKGYSRAGGKNGQAEGREEEGEKMMGIVAVLGSLAIACFCLGIMGAIIDRKSRKEKKRALYGAAAPKVRKVVDYWHGEIEA